MRALVAFVVVAELVRTASAQDLSPKPESISAAINRGLDFLTRDALAWKTEHNCVSCHHASLVVWSMLEAKQHGYPVDESVLADLTKWMAESGDGKTGVPRPEGIPKALNTKAVYFAIALAADPEPGPDSQEGLKRMLETIKSDQLENGSWAAWPETRPPIFGGSDESMTALAVLSVLPAAASGDAAAIAVRDKSLRWFAESPTDGDLQSLVLRLVLWRRLGRPAEEYAPLVRRITERQNPDGGWCQTTGMPSDAWATGQALYALAHAGVKSDEPAVARGHTFLATTQREDGSWPMTSRPTKPGGEGSKSLIPITGAGSAWAVLGLVRSR